MTAIDCQFDGCNVKIEHTSEAVALAMFQSHMMIHQAKSTTNSAHSQKLPPIQRPEVKQDITEEDWDTFVIEWSNFKRCTSIPATSIVDQLYQCCEKGLARLLIREQPDIASKDEDALLQAIKRFSVIKIATSVRRSNLLSTRQSHGESFREFYANVKAAASTCNFKVKCPNTCCNNLPLVDYTSNVIKDIVVLGIADADIQKDVLAWEELDAKNDLEVVAFIESKELARNAWVSSQSSAAAASSNAAAISSYRRDKNHVDKSLDSKLAMRGKCMTCKNEISLYKKYHSGSVNKTPFKLCQKCFRSQGQKSKVDAIQSASDDAQQSDATAISNFYVGAVEFTKVVHSAAPVPVLQGGDNMPTPATGGHEAEACITAKVARSAAPVPARQGGDNMPTPAAGGHEAEACMAAIVLDHHIFAEEDGWRKITALSHPTLALAISVEAEDYTRFGYACPILAPMEISVVVDSGAQSCLWSRRDFLASGFRMNDLIPVKHNMKAANRNQIQIDGAILIRLSGNSRYDESIACAVMVYVSPDANFFYLSKEAMVQLRIIGNDFPQLGAVPANLSAIISASETCQTEESIYANCGCLKRELPPQKPNALPFEATLENADRMKEWLLSRFASSTFNKCPHEVLPTMEGPPIQMHIEEHARPVSLRKPAPVPLHWQEQVERDLQRDVALGVLERVPHGEPTNWCFRMVVTRKDDGSPRRTVDLSPLNKFCERELHTSRSPFNLARSVPAGSVKTVWDAWNGYHSVPIREEDRHLTTFTTPWGLFRYKRAPQGFLSSGDGYNRRLDDLTSHIARMERCVDDSLLHDQDLETHWWRAIDFLELCGRAGIVLNPEKFQFSQSTVDFAGFRISNDTVEPLPKYLDAIRGFPTPRSLTDIKSWFGMVAQVAHYARLRDMLEPFRKFLSPKVKFEWNQELDNTFEETKLRIVEAIRDGVQIFDITKRTCLRTDWSKSGVGYLLAQKHCSCSGRSYGCCQDGWRITLAGSRFLTPAEKNYAPVEGEALAVAWALEQTKFFTMGCNDLLIIVDHKPLVKILGDRRLDEIENPRLFRLKRKTLMWRYEIEYQRGSRNPFADAMSRYPNAYAELASIAMADQHDSDEGLFISSIGVEMEKVVAITWEMVQSESARDQTTCLLRKLVLDGFPDEKRSLRDDVQGFWEVRQHLSVSDGVVLYKDRIVIPGPLRDHVINNLHSAHQGVSSMLSRATASLYWPRMTNDIHTARSSCRACNRNAPSQARLPPTAPELPTTPFEKIAADFFDLRGKHFLVIADRLSGWTEVVQVKAGSPSAGSKGLCDALRTIFITFGVPNEISSDGGSEFTSGETQDFLSRWGTRHRLSSAYFPQSNGRAEVAVRVTKRLLEENMDTNGNLNNDKVARALLQQRNTPDKECNLSPAQVLLGRQLRDTLPQLDKSRMVFENDQVRSQWHQAWSAKEDAIRARLVSTCEKLEPNSRELTPLMVGDKVLIQNQVKSSGRPNKWDRQGVIIASKNNDQYLVKVDGTGRLTLRNRRFLRKFIQPDAATRGTPVRPAP